MEGNAWVLEKILGILSEEEYYSAIETLKRIEREFEEWGHSLVRYTNQQRLREL